MAGELKLAHGTGGDTVVATIWNSSGNVWYIAGDTFEAWGTGGRTISDYGISLTDKGGGYYLGDMDTDISSGVYEVALHVTGSMVGSYEIDWDGAGSSTINDKLDAILADTDELQGDWTNDGRLDVILDSIVEDTNELQDDWTDDGRLDVILDSIVDDTDEIQGKLPTNYIMGSSDTTDKDDEIDDIVTQVSSIALSAAAIVNVYDERTKD